MRLAKQWIAVLLAILMLMTVGVSALAEEVSDAEPATEAVAEAPAEEPAEEVREIEEDPAADLYYQTPAEEPEEEAVCYYRNYVSIGDSCGSGVGLPYYLELVKETGQKWITCTEIEGSYPALVAEAVGAENFDQFHFPGARTADIRYLLDKTFRTDWVIEGQAMYLSEGTISKAEMDAHRDAVIEAVRNADLITIDVGINDYWLPIIAAIYDIAGDGRLGGGALTVPELVARFGSIGALVDNAMSYLRAWIMNPLHAPSYVLKLMSALYKWVMDYQVNTMGILNQIYKLNPNAKVVVCGTYNAVEGWDLIPFMNDRIIEHIMQPFYDLVNLRKKLAVQFYRGDAVYVEMSNVQLFSDDFTIPLFEFAGVTQWSFNPHPTLVGALTQRDHILKALGIPLG